MLFILTAVLFPSAAFAHTGVGNTTGFLHGFEHPRGSIDHFLAMVAVWSWRKSSPGSVDTI
ncbi:MAG: HupE/UreJ family protein [Fulvimarina manganoxydans]|uniref:HupE/UreJ family protein n=1 Tax=Fulvimarina manganoxydans TaxID=937218 RepID=UPI0030811DE9|nr:HupE/UreJ family protein [Fulvimarina manganoxydans]